MFEGETQSYYEILDVKPDAGQNEIRQAYFRAKAAYGKDSAALYSLFDEQQTRLVIETIEQAYLVLSNPEKRKEYDKVHGFLKSGDVLPTIRKTPSQSNVFSFGKGEGPGGDAAHQAAHAVFGAGAMSDANATEANPSATFPAATGSKPIRDEHTDDYSTPRTLASAQAAGPPVQEYISPSSFNSRENRLGLVRRIDLVKPYEKNPTMEDEIAVETAFRGEFFRKVREYKSISVDELSDFTKISRTYINCIESEEFESLPAPAYLRGFIIQIAKALKLPHEKAATAYMAHYKSVVLK